jgi:hypothetical protein
VRAGPAPLIASERDHRASWGVLDVGVVGACVRGVATFVRASAYKNPSLYSSMYCELKRKVIRASVRPRRRPVRRPVTSCVSSRVLSSTSCLCSERARARREVAAISCNDTCELLSTEHGQNIVIISVIKRARKTTWRTYNNRSELAEDPSKIHRIWDYMTMV